MIIAGNWKMHMTGSQAIDFIKSMEKVQRTDIKVILCVPATALPLISRIAREKGIETGLQNMHWEEEGEYTGELSAEMLRDAGGTQVIVGHSKRRSMFHETDTEVNLKVRAAQRNGISPIVCVGETLQQRESGEYHKILCNQLVAGLIGVKSAPLTIAYEPIWAIGTGVTATLEQINETLGWIRRVLAEQFEENYRNIPILYGGSVKPDNAASIAGLDVVDGFLIGRASLTAKSMKDFIDLF
jgi:triosephosphate isomerase